MPADPFRVKGTQTVTETLRKSYSIVRGVPVRVVVQSLARD